MSEKDPSLTLNMGDGRKFEMRPENATLYTFMGRTAIGDMVIQNESLNHVFVVTSPPEQQPPSGMYFFQEFDKAYDHMAEHMVEHQYPMILHQREIPACDLKAWTARVDAAMAQFSGQIPDSLPEK